MKVGVLGGGQLGRMLALAGIPLGLEFVFLDNTSQACAAGLGEFIHSEFDDEQRLSRFAKTVDVITLEFESIPSSTVDFLSQHATVFPDHTALETAQDRLREKQLFDRLEIPVPHYYPADSAEQLRDAAQRHGETLMVKSRRWGYDGKGQGKLGSPQEAPGLWERLGGHGLLAEQLVAFQREVSLIAVRNRGGEVRFYPLAENVHHNGILISSRPVRNDPLQGQAEEYVRRTLEALDYVGVLAFEFFDLDGRLLANEIAPRVHNSGHWSIEGCVSSQFENHLRAIADLPLGETRLREDCVMYNCIGQMPDPRAVLRIPGAHLHDYGKQARAGRKVGHITLTHPSAQDISTIETLLDL